MLVKICWCLALWTLEWSHLVDSGAITSPLSSRPLWQCSIVCILENIFTPVVTGSSMQEYMLLIGVYFNKRMSLEIFFCE